MAAEHLREECGRHLVVLFIGFIRLDGDPAAAQLREAPAILLELRLAPIRGLGAEPR